MPMDTSPISRRLCDACLPLKDQSLLAKQQPYVRTPSHVYIFVVGLVFIMYIK